MMRNDYRRALILLRSNASGYSGHVRLERRTLMGTMYFLVQSPGDCPALRAALVGRSRDGGYFACALGELQQDARGQAVLGYSFDPRDICKRELEQYQLIAITCAGDESCQVVLFGNVCGHAELNWEGVRGALCELYAGEAGSAPGEAASEPPAEPEGGAQAEAQPGEGAQIEAQTGAEPDPQAEPQVGAQAEARANGGARAKAQGGAQKDARSSANARNGAMAKVQGGAQAEARANGGARAEAQSGAQAEGQSGARAEANGGLSAPVTELQEGSAAPAADEVTSKTGDVTIYVTHVTKATPEAPAQAETASSGDALAGTIPSPQAESGSQRANLPGAACANPAQTGTAQSATQSDAAQYTAQPDAAQYTAQPDAAQYTTQPDVAQYVAQPDAAQYTAQPDVAQYAAQPDIAQYAAQSDATQYTAQPDIAQYAAQPGVAPAGEALACDLLEAEGVSASSPWPGAAEALRALFRTEPALTDAPDDGCVYVEAPMPEGSGFPFVAAGLLVLGGALAAIRYALPAAWSEEPPAGLEECAWIGDQNRGWWVTEVPLEI